MLSQSLTHSHNRRNNILFESSHSFHSLFVSVPLFAGVFHYVHLLQLFFAVAWNGDGLVLACDRMHGQEGNALLAEGNDRGVNLLNLPSGVALFPLSLCFIALPRI